MFTAVYFVSIIFSKQKNTVKRFAPSPYPVKYSQHALKFVMVMIIAGCTVNALGR